MNLQDGLNINKYLNVIDTATVDTDLLKQKVNGVNLGGFNENVKLLGVGASSYHGYYTAMSDNRIVVGAWGEGVSGYIYIYDVSGQFISKVTSSDIQASDSFGACVTCSNTRIVVGAIGEDARGSSAGAAYIFDINGNEIKKFHPLDPQAGDFFGQSVAISDTKIVVAADAEEAKGTNAGSVYIFDLDGNQIRKIQGSDTQAEDGFGRCVAISNNRIVVGSDGEDTAGTTAGAAYIFDLDGNEIAKIQGLDTDASDQFGWSVACNDTRIVVGAIGQNTGNAAAGAAYIFDINGNQIAKIQAPTPIAERFGWSLDVSNDIIAVGGPQANSGKVYIFDLNGNCIEEFDSSDGVAGDQFGYNVSVNNNLLVSGAYTNDDNGTDSGATYLLSKQLLPTTTSDIAGTQEESVTYANIIDEVYNII